MIKEIRDYFLKCDFLEENALVNVDYLGDQRVTYSINIDPTQPVLKKYTDGGALKAVNFSFTSLNHYTSSAKDNIDNLEFYSKLERWVQSNNKKGVLPEITEGRAQEVEVLTSGYLFDTGVDEGSYMIQLRLIYEED